MGFLSQAVVSSLRMLLEGYKYLSPQNRSEGGYERSFSKQGPLPDLSTLFILAFYTSKFRSLQVLCSSYSAVNLKLGLEAIHLEIKR